MLKPICLLPLALLFCLSVFAQTKNEIRMFTPDQPIERESGVGESHTYQITLQAGQYVRVVVEQKAIDVALALAAPDGKQVVEVDLSGAGWLEPLSAEAAASGDYRLTVRAKGSATLVGSYQVRLEVKAAATAQDRRRLSAERLLAEARKSLLKRAAEPALENAQPALALCRELGDRYWEGFAWFVIGTAHFVAMKHEQALDSYSQALAIMRELKDRAGEANTLKNMGNANISLGRNEQAIEYLEQALPIMIANKHRLGEAGALTELGRAYSRLSRYDTAIEYYERALTMTREIKNRVNVGKEIKGEGLVGLTRGFMYAGAARVVVSLWNVNDKATAELMAKFYEKMLKQGQRPAAALRAAQVEMWKQKQWQSPYYWAAFTMQGEWR